MALLYEHPSCSSQRTMTLRRRCKSIATYCVLTGFSLRRLGVLAEPSVSAPGPSRRGGTSVVRTDRATQASGASACRPAPRGSVYARAAMRSFITSVPTYRCTLGVRLVLEGGQLGAQVVVVEEFQDLEAMLRIVAVHEPS